MENNGNIAKRIESYPLENQMNESWRSWCSSVVSPGSPCTTPYLPALLSSSTSSPFDLSFCLILNKRVMLHRSDESLHLHKKSHPSDPVPSSLTLLCVSRELSGAWERPLENTLRSAVLVTLVSASERRDPKADTESSHRTPLARPLCSGKRKSTSLLPLQLSYNNHYVTSLHVKLFTIVSANLVYLDTFANY